MSELKVFYSPDGEYTKSYYLKSEADKVIADLEENHKKEVEQLLILNREQANAANRLRDSMEKALRHQKFKRCLRNAEGCLYKVWYYDEDDRKASNRMWKWRNRWLKIAEKFKGAK